MPVTSQKQPLNDKQSITLILSRTRRKAGGLHNECRSAESHTTLTTRRHLTSALTLSAGSTPTGIRAERPFSTQYYRLIINDLSPPESRAIPKKENKASSLLKQADLAK